MPVVSVNTIVDPNQQPDGRRFIRFEWTVTGGEVFPVYGHGKYFVDQGPGTQAEEVDKIRDRLQTRLNRQLEFREAGKILYSDQKLVDLQNLQHTTPQRVMELLFRRGLMEKQDRNILVQLKPIVDYIKANYTAAQIRNATGLTNAQLTKLDQRISIAADPQTFTDLTPEEIEEQVQAQFEASRERLNREKD